MNSINIRQANRDDVDFLIPLIAESSGGVWPMVWKALAKMNESVEVSGKRYLLDIANDLSIKNTILIESGDARMGVMIYFQEGRKSLDKSDFGDRRALPAQLDKVLQPYRELSVPNSLFIAEICFLPEARGKGLGTRLLEYAIDSAIERGLPRVTLRVFSNNPRAVHFYERFGFQIVDKRPVIPHPDIKVVEFVYLMSYSIKSS